jgi:RNA polymerase sigma-70 factor (ECF subfamily)
LHSRLAASKMHAMTLLRRLEAAERATPGVATDSAEFLALLQQRLATADDPERELSALHVEDLYLTWALGRGDRAAFARFERDFVALLATQIKGAAAEAGELEQQVRTRLFVPAEGQPARITQYSGRGPLGGWLRMIATRCLLDIRRSRDGEQRRELDSPSVPTDPELDYLKLRYAADFKLALEAALAQLDARQVTLLKLSFIEQLPASAIGVMYGVSSRTVQRWLVDLRDAVRASTRQTLQARIKLSPTELESLLGLIDSQLSLSLHRALGEPAKPAQ